VQYDNINSVTRKLYSHFTAPGWQTLVNLNML